jgi:hypothetical protein
MAKVQKTEAVGYINMLTFVICVSILEFIVLALLVVIIMLKAFTYMIPWSVTFIGMTIIMAMTCYSIVQFKTVLNDMKENATKAIELNTCPEYFLRDNEGNCINLFTNPYDPTEQYRMGKIDAFKVNAVVEGAKAGELCKNKTPSIYAWSELDSKCMYMSLTGTLPKN